MWSYKSEGARDTGGLHGFLYAVATLCNYVGVGIILALVAYWGAALGVWLEIPFCVERWGGFVAEVRDGFGSVVTPVVGPKLDGIVALGLPVAVCAGAFRAADSLNAKAGELERRP